MTGATKDPREAVLDAWADEWCSAVLGGDAPPAYEDVVLARLDAADPLRKLLSEQPVERIWQDLCWLERRLAGLRWEKAGRWMDTNEHEELRYAVSELSGVALSLMECINE
jgi:hypothetical protein